MSKLKEGKKNSDKTKAATTPKEKKAMKAFNKQERNNNDEVNL